MATFPQLIPNDAINTTVPPDEFQQSFADTVGDLGTAADGFDAIFNDAALALDGVDSILSALDGLSADLQAAVDPLNTVLEQDALDTLEGAISSGDQLLGAISGALPAAPTVTLPPLPVPTPAPPPSSGGGSTPPPPIILPPPPIGGGGGEPLPGGGGGGSPAPPAPLPPAPLPPEPTPPPGEGQGAPPGPIEPAPEPPPAPESPPAPAPEPVPIEPLPPLGPVAPPIEISGGGGGGGGGEGSGISLEEDVL